jgi:hypothetical protein
MNCLVAHGGFRAARNETANAQERLALMQESRDVITAYMPQKYNVHRIVTWKLQ